jgi:uncharacterized membrane protein
MAALGVILLGAILRLSVFLQRPPLWIDEAMIALNVGRRPADALLLPLDWDQVAPLGWLLLERGLVLGLGMHEWVLRAPALLAGIATPWVVWRVTRRWLGGPTALVATLLIATNPAMIYHANEVKPYAMDPLGAIVLLAAAWSALQATTPAARQAEWRRLGFLGLLVPLFSLPGILVLGGLGAVLLSVAIRRRDRGMLATVFGWGVVWLAAFVPAWVIAYRPTTDEPTMRLFWADAMAGLGTPGLRERMGDLVNQLARLVTAAPPWQAWPLVFALAALGLALLWTRGHGRVAILTVSPLLVLGIGWLTDLVAVGVRVSLWVVPSLCIFIAWALVAIAHSSRWTRAAAVLTIGATALSGAIVGHQRTSSNGGRALIEGVLAAQPGVVYLSAGAIPHWLVATTDWTAPDTTRLDDLAMLGSAGGPLFHNTPSRQLAPAMADRTDGIVPREILGRPAGMRIEYGGRRDLVAIPGWGDAEADRIAPHAAAGIHVLLIFAQPAEQGALFRGLRAADVPIHACGTDRRAWWWYVGATPPIHCTPLHLPQRS